MTIDSGSVFPGYSRKEDPWGESPSGKLGDTYYDDQTTPEATPEQLKTIDDFRNGRISLAEAARRLDEIAEEV